MSAIKPRIIISAQLSDMAKELQFRFSQNILHNWDFRTPVNQRGQSEYVQKGYTIDRWYSAGMNVLVINGAVRLIRGTSTYADFAQRIEGSNNLKGKTVTLSVNLLEYGITTFTCTIPTEDSFALISPDLANRFVVRMMKSATNAEIRFEIVGSEAMPGDYIDVESVKLELGTVSTLANDPPMDYGRELAVCQRYCYVHGGKTSNDHVGYAWGLNATACVAGIDFPTPMRVSPTLSLTGNMGLSQEGGTIAVNTPTGVYTGTHGIRFNMSGSGIVNGKAYGLMIPSVSRLILDAEL